MCGIAGIFGRASSTAQLEAMVSSQHHRGPDASGSYVSPIGTGSLGHNRLSIIDLSEAGNQPMFSHDGRFCIVFNGEIYNYLELRAELDNYPFHSRTDTEVILAAYERWGEECLDRFIGMFAFLIWDEGEQRLFAARDRFGVKPLYYHLAQDGTLIVSSEIKALHASGVPRVPDPVAWSTYLAYGLYDHSARTFWKGIQSLLAGHKLCWEYGKSTVSRWYDLAKRVGTDFDSRSVGVVKEEYIALLADSVKLRFRSDVPVGINLSGGLDSSTLLGAVHAAQGSKSDVKTFTFVTGDPQYDEFPWVDQMLQQTRHTSVVCRLQPQDVPALALSVQSYEDEPFGGLPTLAYAKLFQDARASGVIVLLDGSGVDEQWAGYDYYTNNVDGKQASLIQGTKESPVRPECLIPEFRTLAEPLDAPQPFPDRLRNLQYRDALYTKLPRALRFNDRVSMRSSTELREPFLDHRLFELALRQPPKRKINNGTRKWMLRQIAATLAPRGVVEAPKRPLQTPQREWLRGPLRDWAEDQIEEALATLGGAWLDCDITRQVWRDYSDGEGDNSFYIWQWISATLVTATRATSASK